MSDDGNIFCKYNLCAFDRRNNTVLYFKRVIFRLCRSCIYARNPAVGQIAIDGFLTEITVDKKIFIFAFQRNFFNFKICKVSGSGADYSGGDVHAVFSTLTGLCSRTAFDNDIDQGPRGCLINDPGVFLIFSGADMQIKACLPNRFHPACNTVKSIRFEFLSSNGLVAAVMFFFGPDFQNILSGGGRIFLNGKPGAVPKFPMCDFLTEITVFEQVFRHAAPGKYGKQKQE